MPEISRFYGIIVRMYYREHNPPHFHAEYGSDDVVIEIRPIRVYSGTLPRRAFSFVFEWAALHQEELMRNWDLMRDWQAPEKIEPLE